MSSRFMKIKGLGCSLNMPEKLDSCFNEYEEILHFLPPYATIDAYPVDEYPGCPDNWMHGSDISSSYFVKIEEEKGMWLDFNSCWGHTHEVAIVISIQGINPITGQKMVGEKSLRLEQYHKKCPIHDIDFNQERYCKKCNFKWPNQNYLATTGTPYGLLWLDGFRAPDGKVRQYIFTSEEIRGIASQMIGEERVFAIGIAFYISKEKKSKSIKYTEERDVFPSTISPGGQCVGGYWGYNMGNISATWSAHSSLSSSSTRYCLDRYDSFCNNNNNNNNNMIQEGLRNIKTNVNHTIEIGAGALIRQNVYDDPKTVDFWEEKPTGMIYINYCDEYVYKSIMKQGRRSDKQNGFMDGLKVGS